MRTLVIRPLAVLVILAMAWLAAPANAQEQNIVQGELLRLDVNAKKIVIRTETGSQMQFEYTEETVVNGADETVAGLGTQRGTLVTVKYEKQETRLLAVQIDVHQKE